MPHRPVSGTYCIAPAQFERRMMLRMLLIAPSSDRCVAWRLPFEVFDRPS